MYPLSIRLESQDHDLLDLESRNLAGSPMKIPLPNLHCVAGIPQDASCLSTVLVSVDVFEVKTRGDRSTSS